MTDIGHRDTFIAVSRVRAARKEKGLSQEELADRSRCAQPTISEIERGEYQPSMALAQRIAAALGKTLDELFGEVVAP